MQPISSFDSRHRLINRLKFISIVLGVTIVGVILLMNVRALGPSTANKEGADMSRHPAGPPPSGQPMPLGDIAGWRQVFTDDFLGTSLEPQKWQAYAGPAGGVPNTLWDTAHARVHDGLLELKNTRVPGEKEKWVSAGVSSAAALHQTYGKYSVRFRIDKGEGITSLILLWPADNKWPPEIDFAENGGGDRSYMNATLHHRAGDDQKIQHVVRADFSQWHTMGVEWLPGQLRYTLDDKVWATLDSTHVPKVPMALDIQTQTGICGNTSNPCPNESTPQQVSMYIDWAVAYAPGK